MAKSRKETRIITAALPFVNNIPHLGNIVGSHLPADIFARFCRLNNHRTIFVGGTDEHGTAIEFAAQIQHKTPKQLCDELHEEHKKIYNWFGISYDNFSRTSRKIHHELVKDFFLKLYKNGFITEKTIQIPFCLKCQKGLADRYITGTCPHCGYDQANGDQCEKCATLIDPIELKNPHCSVCKSRDIEFRNTKHLFLDLRSIAGEIELWLNNNKNLRPQVRNLAKGWLKQGLQERCITRDLKWGVQVPLKGYQDKVFYVWFDNVIGYISATYELLGKEALKLWKSKNVKTYYFLGKDNIPFHTIFWPGQIIGQKEFVLPYNVVGYQYLNFEGQKFSKSKKIGIFSDQVIDSELPLDFWRFYLVNILPETKDTDFSTDDFQESINNKLIANFANFINRTLSFLDSKFAGELPKQKLTAEDKTFWKTVEKQIDLIISSLEKVELRQGLEEILTLSALGNKYFQENEPWKDLGRAKTIIYVCANLCLSLSLLIQPYLPATSQKILQMLRLEMKDWKNVKKLNLKAGHKISKPELLFHKLEDEQIEELKAKTSKVTEFFSEKKQAEKKVFPADLHVAKILSVADHPNADSLYLLQIDLGTEKRQLVAGLKKYFSKEQLLHKKIVVCANLKPAKIRGIESKGMLLAADDGQKVALLEAVKSEPGAAVSPEGYTNDTKELAFEEFIKLNLEVKTGKAVYQSKTLKTKSEEIHIKGINEGAKIR